MKKRFIKIAIIAMLFMLVYATVVNALSFTVTLTPSSTVVKEGGEFTVKVAISNLDVGNGLVGVSGFLKYDQDVFEPITETSIDALNSWTVNFSPDNGKIALTKKTFVKSEEDVFTVTFKTKEGVSGKQGNIKFESIQGTNNESDIPVTDVSTTVTVGEVSGNLANVSNTNSNTIKGSINATTNTTANTIKPTNTNTNTNSSISSYVNSINSTSGDDIPYTGAEDTIMYIIAGIILIAVISYIRFERINKEMK